MRAAQEAIPMAITAAAAAAPAPATTTTASTATPATTKRCYLGQDRTKLLEMEMENEKSELNPL